MYDYSKPNSMNTADEKMEETAEYKYSSIEELLELVFSSSEVTKPSYIATATTEEEELDKESVDAKSVNNAELFRYDLEFSFLGRDTTTPIMILSSLPLQLIHQFRNSTVPLWQQSIPKICIPESPAGGEDSRNAESVGDAEMLRYFRWLYPVLKYNITYVTL